MYTRPAVARGVGDARGALTTPPIFTHHLGLAHTWTISLHTHTHTHTPAVLSPRHEDRCHSLPPLGLHSTFAGSLTRGPPAHRTPLSAAPILMSQRRCHLLLLCCAVPLLLARSAPSPPPSPSLDAAARERASTALRYAVDIGDEAKVEAAIQAGANVNDLGSNQQPPLVMASLAGHAGIIKLLLAAGADTTIGEGSGYTPLHAAAYQGQAEAVKVLLESGVKPEFHSDGAFTEGRRRRGSRGARQLERSPHAHAHWSARSSLSSPSSLLPSCRLPSTAPSMLGARTKVCRHDSGLSGLWRALRS